MVCLKVPLSKAPGRGGTGWGAQGPHSLGPGAPAGRFQLCFSSPTTRQDLILSLPLTSCADAGKLFILSEPQGRHLWYENREMDGKEL